MKDSVAGQALDMTLVANEWPRSQDTVYLNSGSCGVKPKAVLQALSQGWEWLNDNPTLATFLDPEPWENARLAAANLLSVPKNNLLLTPNSTYGIQMVMQSFLLKRGDELVMTNHEHASMNTLSKYMAESRGVVVKTAKIDPSSGSEAFAREILKLVGRRTKLVAFSEIDCYTGWCPNPTPLLSELKRSRIPVLVDGAHRPGQGQAGLLSYPLWVASGHKWLCGPNGTGFLYAQPEYLDRLQPLLVGDRFYLKEAYSKLTRFEWSGTADPVRLRGLEAACNLQMLLGQDKIRARQLELVDYLRRGLKVLPGCRIRTPETPSESCGTLTFYFESGRLPPGDLRELLWNEHKILIQPDFIGTDPNSGMRISCHIYTDEQEIDRLIDVLSVMLR